MASSMEVLINGLLLGAMYGLFGLGLSLGLGVMRIINIAHGDLIVLGAYVAGVSMQATGLGALASLCLVMPAMFLLGYALQALVLNRVVGRDPLAPLLVTFGLSVVVQNLLSELFTANTASLPASDFGLRSLHLWGVSVGLLPLLIAATSVGVYALTSATIGRTHWGRQVRAVADDPATARLIGVRDKRLFALTAGVTFAVMSIASVMYGMRTPFSPSAGADRLLYAFEAVVLGGLGNLWGTLLGGLAIGLTQVVGSSIDPGLGPLAGHVLFLATLMLRRRRLSDQVEKS